MTSRPPKLDAETKKYLEDILAQEQSLCSRFTEAKNIDFSSNSNNHVLFLTVSRFVSDSPSNLILIHQLEFRIDDVVFRGDWEMSDLSSISRLPDNKGGPWWLPSWVSNELQRSCFPNLIQVRNNSNLRITLLMLEIMELLSCLQQSLGIFAGFILLCWRLFYFKERSLVLQPIKKTKKFFKIYWKIWNISWKQVVFKFNFLD